VATENVPIQTEGSQAWTEPTIPTEEFREYHELMIRQICSSLGMPRAIGVVYPERFKLLTYQKEKPCQKPEVPGT